MEPVTPQSKSLKEYPALAAWLESSRPGENFTYFRGKHARHCQHAALLRRLAESGAVLLFQRRHGEADYEYIAMRANQLWGKRLAPNWSWTE